VHLQQKSRARRVPYSRDRLELVAQLCFFGLGARLHPAECTEYRGMSSQQSHKEHDADDLGIVVVRMPQVPRQHAGGVARARSATEVEWDKQRRSTFFPRVIPLLQVASERQIDTHPRDSLVECTHSRSSGSGLVRGTHGQGHTCEIVACQS